MCSYSLLLVNSIFSCQLFLYNFSHVCQIYVAEGLIMHFCNYYHLRFLSPYGYQSEVNFCAGQLQIHTWLQIHIWVEVFDLNLGSTPALAQVPSISHLSSLWQWRVHSGSSSGPISVSPELIVGVYSRKMQSTPLLCLQTAFCCA